jgi:tetratricopeptide (TPR) repeat protein
VGAKSRTGTLRTGRAASTDILLATGTAAQARGDIAVAEKAFRRVLTIDPTNAPAVQCLGAILVDRDDIDEAIDLFEAAAEKIGPPTKANVGFYNNYANALRRAERYVSAERLLRKVLELDRMWLV